MSTGKLRIITPNDADTAALSAAPALVATLPVANLQSPSRAAVARTTSTADQDILGTWGANKIISALALVRHNLSSTATWRLRLYSDAAWTTVVYDTGAIGAVMLKALGDLEWGVDALGASLFDGWALRFSNLWFTPVVARSFRLTWSDATNAAGYIEASRLFVGRYLEPSVNFDWGLGLTWKEDTTQERTEGGTLRSDGFEPYRRMSFRLSWLPLSDRPKWQEWARRDGRRKDVFISAYPQDGSSLERDHAMAAKLVESPEMVHSHVANFASPYIVEEA